MRIAVIIDIWEPLIGGSQSHVREIAYRLVNNHGFEVDIFTRSLIYNSRTCKDNEEYFHGKLRIIRVAPATRLSNTWGRIATLWTVAWKVAVENRKKDYDLIHAHSILGGAMGKVASYLTGKPLIFTVHGSMNLDRGVKNIDYFIEKWILTQISYDKLISVAKGFLKYRNVNKNIEIIPNGVSIHDFDMIRGETKADYLKIIFVGRLHWQKGIDTLIEAIKILKDKQETLLDRKKVQLHLIGYGFDMSKYKKMTSRYGLNEQIIFRGKIRGENLIREYKSSHLFILPSLCEGQPITFLEAMASKLPVLTTHAADNADILSSETGWKVEANNPEALANKLAEIINLDKNILAKMGIRGYETVKSNYTLDNLVTKTIDAYKSLRTSA
ncbi:MAG: glycosyltransferase family 4 protein [Deltaproteobacteria bacterium]|nr:glycosyltransferase family 4 protein [Deltaproteobacteria bacterium]